MKPLDIEKRLDLLEKRISKIESIVFKSLSQRRVVKSGNLERVLVGQIDELPTQHLVVIALELKRKQTKAEIKQTLEDWGKVVGNWFRGGNFNNRLIRKSIVKRDGVNKNNEDLFSLTKKGELLAEELINKIKVPA